ncbi:MAG: hypothetical protein ACLTAF_00650 [Blautia coccoides]
MLIDQAIHSMDRVRYMLGSDIEWIEGSVHNHCHDTVRVEDAETAIQFKNGCINLMPAIPTPQTHPSPLNFREKGRCG